jgi:hypothetical protein
MFVGRPHLRWTDPAGARPTILFATHCLEKRPLAFLWAETKNSILDPGQAARLLSLSLLCVQSPHPKLFQLRVRKCAGSASNETLVPRL